MRKLSGTIVAVGLLGGTAAQAAAPCADPATLGTSREIAVGGPVELGLKTYPHSLALEDHEVVLTFDDGPNPDTTPKILDALEKQCVKATFFLIGANARAHPDLVKREIDDKFTVGHHTLTHPAATLRGLTPEDARKNIEQGFEADDKAAYGSYSGAPKVKFFRFPGFADTPETLAYLNSKNVAVFGTDLWASDWIPMSPEQELRLIMGRLRRAGRGIVLLHDIKRQTAAMLPAFLAALKTEGFRVVHLVPGTSPPALSETPRGWTSETGEILAHMSTKALKTARHEPAPRPPAAELKPTLIPDDPLPEEPAGAR
ncbi:MAG: polysaccharide deacetylase family protein [Parafilimonas terrae]|nr:polysaccharide deacetylase family protein [Parafilimonas terrae]